MGGVDFQLLDFILECKLASFEIYDLEIVYGGMGHCLIDLTLDIAMLALQFFEVAGKRHELLLPFMVSSYGAVSTASITRRGDVTKR
jgi:hypothetical protein